MLSPKICRALKFLSGNKSEIAQLYHHLSYTLKCVVRKLDRETRTTFVVMFIFEIGCLNGTIAESGNSNRRTSEPTADTYQHEGTGEQCPHMKSFACFYTPIELLSLRFAQQNKAFTTPKVIAQAVFVLPGCFLQ